MTTQEPHETDVADLIRQAILDGDLVPNQRLIEADLCVDYSASRASVRGALAELSNEGLVERIPNRGARVRTVSIEEAIEISEVRMVLEGLCASKAAELVTADEARELQGLGQGMKDAFAVGDMMLYSVTNKKLHDRIGEISRQHTAHQIILRSRAQIVRHQYRLAMRPGRPSVSLQEHLDIIDAICRHDPDGAEAALRHHLRSLIDALRMTSARIEREKETQ